MFKVNNNRNIRTRSEKCSKLAINIEHISYLVLVFLLLTLSNAGWELVPILEMLPGNTNFEKVNSGWEQFL